MNTQGCDDEFIKEVTINPGGVTAGFTTDVSEGCSPLSVNITNTSSGNIDSHEWTFGDGTTFISSASTLDHTYVNQETTTTEYTLQLIVSDSTWGCRDTLQQTITVYPEVYADFAADEENGMSPLEVTFTSLSNPVATNFSWDFGDGNTSIEANPAHPFVNNGPNDTIYTVTFIATSDHTCKDTATGTITVVPQLCSEAHFSVDQTKGCSPFTVTISPTLDAAIDAYYWDFGDGTNFTGENPSPKTYTNTSGSPVIRNLRLVVQNGNCYDTLTHSITVHTEMIADFITDEDAGCNPLKVTLTNTSVTDTSATYYWNLGDGSNLITSSSEPIYHTFNNYLGTPIKDTIVLAAVNKLGCADTIMKTINIYPKVTALFTTDKETGESPLIVNFTNQTQNVENYLWDFGNGNTSMEENPVQTFTNHQTNDTTYIVQLIASSPYNCTDTLAKNIIVSPGTVTNITPVSDAHTLKLYPNPVTDFFTVDYYLSSSSDVLIEVYDLNGRKLQTLCEKRQNRGFYSTQFDAGVLTQKVSIIRISINQNVRWRKVIK